jgi:hypothetical protein
MGKYGNIGEKIYQYDLEGNFVREYESTQLAAFINNTDSGSISKNIKGETTHCKYFIYTKEYYIKLPNKYFKKKFQNANRNSYLKPIYEYDLNGNFIQKYENYKKVAFTKNEKTNLREHINGDVKTFLNHIYKFEYYEKLPNEILFKHLNRISLYQNINQYDLNGNYINTYFNTTEIYKSLKISKALVYISINQKKPTKGFIFSLEKFEKLDLKNYKKRNDMSKSHKKIYQYSLDNKLIKTFDSVIEAITITKINNISNAANGVQKTAGGFIWKHKED